jgi:hypothetical protein
VSLSVCRYCLIAADASAARSILVFKTDVDKVRRRPCDTPHTTHMCLTTPLHARYVISVFDSVYVSVAVLRLQITVLDDSKLMAGSGTPADTATFTEYVQKNMKLYELDNDLSLSTHATANFVRGEVRLVFAVSFTIFLCLIYDNAVFSM